MNAFWRFARRITHYRRLVIGGLLAAVIDAACASGGMATLMAVIRQIFENQQTVRQMVVTRLGNPRVMEMVGDVTWLGDYVPAGRFAGFAALLGFILLLAIIGSVFRYLYQMAALTVSFRMVAVIRKDAFQRLIHAPYETVLATGTVDSLSRIVRDSNQLGRGFNALMGKAVRDVLLAVGMLVLALIVNWELTALFLVGLPLIAIAIRKFGKRIRRASKRAMQAYGGMLGAVQESIQNLPVVKASGAEGYERRRFNTINREVLRQEMKARSARALSSPVIETIAIAGVIGVALAAAYLAFETGSAQPAEVVFVLIFLGAAGASAKPLANLNNDLQESAAAARRLEEILELPVETSVRGGFAEEKPALPRHARNVVFENISYAYPGSDRLALQGIDLTVQHGQSVAIVGPNGSGKSTLLSMLPRLLEPKTGAVLIDGHDVRAVGLRSLRGQIGVVTQQSVLFEGTIADNIAYGLRHIDRERIVEAARRAHADEFVRELPAGYDTHLGELGSGLSGGQRQRLCIARAILRNPAMLILDEATSQIDAQSEAKIAAALDAIQEGRTTFIIAHRLSTVVGADMIVVMQDGRIVDRGRHEELLRRCRLYQTLVASQLQPPAA